MHQKLAVLWLLIRYHTKLFKKCKSENLHLSVCSSRLQFFRVATLFTLFNIVQTLKLSLNFPSRSLFYGLTLRFSVLLLNSKLMLVLVVGKKRNNKRMI